MQGKSIGAVEAPSKKQEEEFKARQDAFNKELVPLQEKYKLKVVARMRPLPDGFIAIPMLEDQTEALKKAS